MEHKNYFIVTDPNGQVVPLTVTPEDLEKIWTPKGYIPVKEDKPSVKDKKAE